MSRCTATSVRRTWVVLAMILASRPGATAASPHVVTGGVGLIRLEKRTPVPLSKTSVVGRLEAGLRVGTRTAARIRIEGFRADGLNLFGALVADVDLGKHVGLSGFAGVSFGASSGIGNHFGAGGFARWFVNPAVALRADAFVSVALRNDFGGLGVGLVAGAEWRL
jgi:hypothetical protein